MEGTCALRETGCAGRGLGALLCCRFGAAEAAAWPVWPLTTEGSELKLNSLLSVAAAPACDPPPPALIAFKIALWQLSFNDMHT